MFSRRNVRHLGTERQLFLDDDIIDELSGMKRRLGVMDKHPENPVIKAENAWELYHPYLWGTVLHDAERGYRVWYQSDPGAGQAAGTAVFCYATSQDGIHWQRPALRLVEWQGSRENNIVLAGYEEPTIVERPDEPNPALRYRMLCLAPDRKRWVILSSPDGIHWSTDSPAPGPHRDVGILVRDFAYLCYDERHQQWVSCCKLLRRVGQWPYWSDRRCLAITTSEDDMLWEVPELILTPDALDDALAAQRIPQVADRVTTNHPDEYYCDFQVMAVWPYEGLYIGLISVFDASGLSPTGGQDGTVHIQLAVSRDLRHWERVAERQTFIGLGPRGAFDDSMLLGMSSAPVILDNEVRIYYSGMALSHYNRAYWDPQRMPALRGGIGLATIRRDGFVALEVGDVRMQSPHESFMRTKHFTFTGSKLCVNIDCGAHGWRPRGARVEFVEPDDTPIPGFSREECDVIKVDGLRHVVTWRGNPNISSLQDRIVRLKFYCQTTRLYSFWFEP